ncbi:hypothetical protein C7974DRAFT_373750 [Boeremia exigua]|uniref:uncharacterized protein n=1 Tax=Boeremia exigua TaxID=749465 RepID=UPI001E8D411E|nr:uncharacterized protein C7974DRAFT_373750 [Boeremia exigua]KAH6639527.1 hypothetical protein C7974DRAFT_373750 [Boeremia exigua]
MSLGLNLVERALIAAFLQCPMISSRCQRQECSPVKVDDVAIIYKAQVYLCWKSFSCCRLGNGFDIAKGETDAQNTSTAGQTAAAVRPNVQPPAALRESYLMREHFPGFEDQQYERHDTTFIGENPEGFGLPPRSRVLACTLDLVPNPDRSHSIPARTTFLEIPPARKISEAFYGVVYTGRVLARSLADLGVIDEGATCWRQIQSASNLTWPHV